ncbi:MAG: hypothetical protein WAZ27_05075 [Minisyncoccia bacterium]
MVISTILRSLGFEQKVYPSLKELGIDTEKNIALCEEQRQLFEKNVDTIRRMMENARANTIDLKEIPEIGDLWKRAAQLPEAEWDLAWDGVCWLTNNLGRPYGSVQYASGKMFF